MKITKELIVETALAMVNEEGTASRINLREIARRLGCAHTNLYNYYPSLGLLLWDAHGAALGQMLEAVTSSSCRRGTCPSLKVFYERFLDFYLLNRGLFSLLWEDSLAGERPEAHRKASEEKVERLIGHLLAVYGGSVERNKAHDVLHRVHCYLHGEVSIFVHGRGLIKDEAKFRAYVVDQCVVMTRLFAEK